MLDLYRMLHGSPAFAASGAHVVMRSRSEHDCCCPAELELRSPGGDCGHFGCAGTIARGTSLVRTSDTFGDPVCLPCALALWGVSPAEAGEYEQQLLRRARAATATMPWPVPPGPAPSSVPPAD